MSRRVIIVEVSIYFFFFSSRRRHTRFDCDWSSDVCSSDLPRGEGAVLPTRRRAAGQARLLLALVAPGARRPAVDPAALLVSRLRRPAAVLRRARGHGLQRPVREDAVLPLFVVGDARLVDRNPGQGEGGGAARGARRAQSAGVLDQTPCMTSRPPSGAAWTGRSVRRCGSFT